MEKRFRNKIILSFNQPSYLFSKKLPAARLFISSLPEIVKTRVSLCVRARGLSLNVRAGEGKRRIVVVCA